MSNLYLFSDKQRRRKWERRLLQELSRYLRLFLLYAKLDLLKAMAIQVGFLICAPLPLYTF